MTRTRRLLADLKVKNQKAILTTHSATSGRISQRRTAGAAQGVGIDIITRGDNDR